MKTLIVIFLVVSTASYGQYKKVKKLPPIMDASYIFLGLSMDAFVKEMKDRGEYHESRYEHKDSPSIQYIHVEDLRFDNKMFMTRYEYSFRHDSVSKILIHPNRKDNWEQEILKDHDYLGDQSYPKIIAHMYVAKNGRYRLAICDIGNDFVIEAFPN